MGRFSDIKRGGQLNQKLTAYTAYLQNPPAPRLNTQGDRPEAQQVFVTPFGLDLGTDKVVAVNVAKTHFTKLGGIINTAGTGAEVLAALDTKESASIGRFRPARVSVFESQNKTKTTPNSRYTGKPYLKYAGDSFSCPFGRKVATDDIQDAFGMIKTALKARANLAVNRVSLTVERFYA